jgi:hypothetical protein
MTRVSAQLYFPSRLMVHEGIRNRSGWRFQSEPAHGVVRRIVGATCSSKELVLKSPYFEAANRKSSFGCPWMGLWMMWKATCLQGIVPTYCDAPRGASPTVLAVVSDKGSSSPLSVATAGSAGSSWPPASCRLWGWAVGLRRTSARKS